MDTLPHYSLLLLDNSIYNEKICCKIQTGMEFPVKIDIARTKDDFLNRVAIQPYDALIADIAPELFNPFNLLCQARTALPEVLFIFLCDPVYEDIALQLLAAGADDYVFKDKPDKLRFVIAKLVRCVLKEKEIQLARKKLEETVQNLKFAQSISQVGSWDWDIVNNELSWSDESYRQLGTEPGFIVSKTGLFLQRMSPEDQDRVRCAVQLALENNEPFEVEFGIVGMDGTERQIVSRGTVLQDTEGKPVWMKGTLQDITEKKKIAEAQRQREYLLQKIIDSSYDLIYLKDRQGRLILANKAMEKLYNKRLDELIDHTVLDYIPSQDCAVKAMNDDKKIIELNQDQDTEDSIEFKDGERIFSTSKSPWHDETGNIMGIVGISHDITVRKNLELTLEKQKSELEQKNKLILDFFINISHEFKTPIAAIMLALEAMSGEAGKKIAKREDFSGWNKSIRQNA
ncbi:MAG: PAS domain-containing protein, partial [Eubacteriales bacterium]